MQAALLRTPGVYFLPAQKPVATALPPLHVAGFVGFAERGPLDVPVPVEDLASFDAIFGTTLVLVRDAAGAGLSAMLRDAVASFFSGGGRRCYIVRVAGAGASRAQFQVPGLLALDDGFASPATIDAAWPGAWSSSTAIGTILQITALPIV